MNPAMQLATVGFELAQLPSADPAAETRVRALAGRAVAAMLGDAPAAAPERLAAPIPEAVPVPALHEFMEARLATATPDASAAYRVGLRLGEFARPLSTPDDLPPRLSAAKASSLAHQVAALQGVLAPGVAAAVSGSLRRWDGVDIAGTTPEALLAAWEDQRRIWAQLICGQLDPHHLLGADAWTAVAGRFARRRGAVVEHVAGRQVRPLLALGLLTVAVVVVAAVTAGGVVLAAVCLAAVALAAAGAWRLVVGDAGAVLSRVQPHLWNAEVAAALADASAVLPAPAPRRVTPKPVVQPAAASSLPPAPSAPVAREVPAPPRQTPPTRTAPQRRVSPRQQRTPAPDAYPSGQPGASMDETLRLPRPLQDDTTEQDVGLDILGDE